LPISKWYPGNPYVDIIGIDAYDKDCVTLKSVSQEGWTAYSTDSAGGGADDSEFPSLANVEAFAVAHGKPMSFPEWGLTGSGDDAAYVAGIAHAFNSGDFAFESYFDMSGKDVTALGAKVPNATAAYAQAFK
jgi:beta-mannanase